MKILGKKNSIVFDFDCTIAKSNLYHRHAWELVLTEFGITCDLDEIFLPQNNLNERYDSYRRISNGLLKNDSTKAKIIKYFSIKDERTVVNKIMNLKEGYTINYILNEAPEIACSNLGLNIVSLLHKLKSKHISIGIISSTRETIINSFLHKCNILDYFNFIIGEESLTDHKNILFDKPHQYANSKLMEKGYVMRIYIGDNRIIDKKFADICNADYIYADYTTDFMKLFNKKSYVCFKSV